MRLYVFSSALCATLFMATAATAQDGQPLDPSAAIEGFLTDTARLGAQSATVGAMSVDGDTVTARDIAMSWSTSIAIPDGTATMTAEATLPSVIVEGLQPAGEGHSARRIAVPEGTLRITVGGTDEPVTYDLGFTGYEVEDASWGAFPQVSADPMRPVSRFSPLVSWAVAQSYRLHSVENITTELKAGDQSQNLSYGPLSFGPVVDGTVASLNYGPFTVNQSMGAGSDDAVKVEYGAITATGIDVRPIAQFLTGIGDAQGPQTVMGSVRADGIDITSSTDESAPSFSMGPMAVENFTIDPTRGPLLERLDPLVLAGLAGREPEPAQIIPLVIDIYGAYGFGRYSFADINFSAPDVKGALQEVAMENVNSGGLGRFAVTGLSVDSDEGAFQMGAFEVRDMTFPSREAVMQTVMGAMTGAGFSPEMLAAFPTVGEVLLRGFEFTEEGDGPVKLGLFDLKQSGFISAIPTQIGLTLEGLEVPTGLLDNPQFAGMLGAMGINALKANGNVSLGWTDENGAVSLEKDVVVDGVGSLKASAGMTGIPRVIFENPMRAEEAMATASIGNVSVRFEDSGLTPFLVGMFSQQAGVTPQEFAAGIAQQLGMQAMMLTGSEEIAEQISSALSAYLADPQSISIAASPPNPVPVIQLVGAAMTAPAQIVSLLNLTISANN